MWTEVLRDVAHCPVWILTMQKIKETLFVNKVGRTHAKMYSCSRALSHSLELLAIWLEKVNISWISSMICRFRFWGSDKICLLSFTSIIAEYYMDLNFFSHEGAGPWSNTWTYQDAYLKNAHKSHVALHQPYWFYVVFFSMLPLQYDT